MRSFLVTGGCGFIGSNFINYYLEKHPDVKIVNVDRLDYCSSVNNIRLKYRNDSSRYVFEHCDINNKEKILTLLKEHSIEVLVHFAAQTHVDNSFGNSLQFTLDNVLGTHTLLECCREYDKLARFVHISTDETYGEVDSEHEGCTEKSLLNPTNPYAATKAAAEFLVRSYYHSFKLPVIITRGNNVYGPNQFPEKLIPRFITMLTLGQKCPIQGTGETRRNFIHAEDVCRAIEIITERGKINEIYNIGSKDEYSVLDIFDKLVKLVKGVVSDKSQLCEWVEDRAFNDFRYAINTDKLESLGWKKQIDFEDGLKSTVNWYKRFLESEKDD